jgi:type III secretion protein Q
MHLLPETRTKLRWQAVRASRAILQIRVESGGEIFEVQWVDDLPSEWPPEILHSAVPASLRREVFEVMVEPVWSRLTKLFGLDGNLIDVLVDQPAWEPREALGWALVPAGSSDGTSLHGMLRASTAAGWVLLAAWAPLGLPLAWVRDAQKVELTVHAPPIPVFPDQLSALCVGDVMLLEAGLGTISRLATRIKLSDRWVPGVRCLFLGHAVMITQTQAKKEATRSDVSTKKPPLAMSATNSASVPPATTAATVDALPIWVDVELARLPLTIEQLRSLSIGQVFELDTSLDPALVVLKCGSQRLGLGQLVAVGERLGVRLVELATPATPVAQPPERAKA